MSAHLATLPTVAVITVAAGLFASAGTQTALPTQDNARGLAVPSVSARRLAFVVGNNNYVKIPALRNAVNDAVDLAATLREMKFTVELVTDAPLEAMERRLATFASQVRAGDVALFFFAGHAVQIEGENHLLGTDFEATDALAAKRRSLAASDVVQQMGKRGPGLRLIILDACRDNPFASSAGRSIRSGLAEMGATGTLIAFSTAPGSTASDNPSGRNGLFTEHLLRNLTLPGRDAVDVLRQVQEDVYKASNHGQTPWLNIGYTGRFYFIAPARPATPAVSEDAGQEEGFWQAASASKDVRLLEEYLNRYGSSGRHAIPARVMLARLRSSSATQPDTARAELARPSVAVLGFRNQSGRAETTWISTALADNINSELAIEKSLRPISGEDVGRMKRELALPDTDMLAHETLSRIRRNLSADLVITGSYLALGSGPSQRIRLNVLVQDTGAGSTLEAFSIEGTVGDGLFDVISQAGTKIREALSLEPRTSQQAAMVRAAVPRGADVAKLYAEGLAALRAFNAQVARDALMGAVKIEPSFALAHAALAGAWQILGQDQNAVASAKTASTAAANLPLEQRLLIEGRFHEMSRQWKEAIDVYDRLHQAAADTPDYGFLLAQAHQLSGDARTALSVIARLQSLPGAHGDDARLDIIAAECFAAVSEFEPSRAAAARAADKGIEGASWLLVARARIAEAGSLLRLGRRNEARAAAEDAKRLYATAGDRRGIARALLEIGNNLRTSGNLAEAENLFREALVITQELGNRRHTARAANNVGATLFEQGKFAEAQKFFEEALTVNREIGDRPSEASAINNVASALYEQGEVQRALELDHQALAIRREIDDVRGVAMSLVNIAEGTSDQTQLADARRMYEEAVALNRKIADDSETAYALSGLGAVLMRQGLLEEARGAHESALKLRVKLEENHAVAESRLALAEIAVLQGRHQDAEAAVRQVLEAQNLAPDLRASAAGMLAWSLLRRGSLPEAENAIQAALKADQSELGRGVRFLIGLTAARVDAGSGRIDAALSRVRALVSEAEKLPAYRLAAELAEGEIRVRSGDQEGKKLLARVEAEASKAGLALISAEAKRLQSAPGR